MTPGTVTGTTPAKVRRATKPAVVYIYPRRGRNNKDPRTAIQKDKAFTRSEAVSVGARLFDRLRIAAADARKDPALKAHASAAPCLVFLRPDRRAAFVMRGPFQSSQVFGAMCKTLELDYTTCARTALKKHKGLVKARAALERDRAKLQKLKARVKGASGTQRSRLVRQRDALAKRVKKTRAELAKREAMIFTLMPKKKEEASTS